MKTEPRRIRIRLDVIRAIQHLAEQEQRRFSNMANVLLLEALEARHQAPADEGGGEEREMRAQDKISNALHTIMDEGDANACQVYKGTDYDGAMQSTGWWYRPFNQQPVYLGTSVTEALDTIEQIADSRQE